jgi:hypothetical protein
MAGREPKGDAPSCHLTVKLRGRTEALALGAEGAQFLSARGAKPEAHHGPLRRLLGFIVDPSHRGSRDKVRSLLNAPNASGLQVLS